MAESVIQKSLASDVSKLNNRNDYTIAQCQFMLPSAVTLSANGTIDICSNLDPRTCAYSALDHVPTTGTLIAATFLWANGTNTVPFSSVVIGGKITCTIHNMTSNALNINSVRFLLVYKN